MKRLLLLSTMLLLAGCGNEGVWDDSATNSPIGGRSPAGNGMADIAPTADSIPVVYISSVPDKPGHFIYRIYDEEYQEREFLGLCSAMLRSKPDLQIRIVPGPMLSKDEIGLVSARIRETGVKSVLLQESDGSLRQTSHSPCPERRSGTVLS